MGYAGLDDSQAEIKIAKRNISYLRYANDMHTNGRKQRGTKESPVEGEKRGAKMGLKLNIQKLRS